MARIVVVGSVAADEVVRLDRRLCEGGYTNGRTSPLRLGGGGANTAVALAAAGHAVSLVTAVGEDETGQWQIDRLTEAGVDISAVVRLPQPSTRSILLVDPEGERTIVNLTRVEEAEPPWRLRGLPADLIYVRARSRLMAPVLEERIASCTVVAHVPPLEAGIFPAHVVVGSASDLEGGVLDDPLAMARKVAGDRLHWVAITQGPGGVRAWSTSGARLSLTAPHVAAVDSTGAGDAFSAGLCHALVGGRTMADALAVAVRWGSEKVRHHGSALSRGAVEAMT
jgi:ribokinase